MNINKIGRKSNLYLAICGFGLIAEIGSLILQPLDITVAINLGALFLIWGVAALGFIGGYIKGYSKAKGRLNE